MKVYAAFEGEYSGRALVGIFREKSKADECSGDVEEHELDALADCTMHAIYEVKIRLDDGALADSGRSMRFEVPNFCRTQTISEWSGGSVFGNGHAVDRFALGVSSVSEDHALKLAAEHRQSYLRESALVSKPGMARVQEYSERNGKNVA